MVIRGREVGRARPAPTRCHRDRGTARLCPMARREARERPEHPRERAVRASTQDLRLRIRGERLWWDPSRSPQRSRNEGNRPRATSIRNGHRRSTHRQAGDCRQVRAEYRPGLDRTGRTALDLSPGGGQAGVGRARMKLTRPYDRFPGRNGSGRSAVSVVVFLRPPTVASTMRTSGANSAITCRHAPQGVGSLSSSITIAIAS